jgi:hypothetical protein
VEVFDTAFTRVRLSLYRLGSDLEENTCHVSDFVFNIPLPSTGLGAEHIENTSIVVRMRVREEEEEKENGGGSARHYIGGGGKKLYFLF